MADITPMIPADRQVIDGYGPGQFCVAGGWRAGALLVLPDRTLPWTPPAFADLTIGDFGPVLAAEPKIEILLLGCGGRAAFPSKQLRQDLRAAGVVVEPMDSPAACRTFNVLLAEGRRVAAALLPV
jgi:uncharacterized protein